MPLGPILPGRLPNSLVTRQLNGAINATKFDLQRIQDQLATGQRFQLPSESPATALRTIILQKSLERKEQYLSNVRTDRSLVNATEDALTNVTDSINSAKGLLLQGLTNSLTEGERTALADEVASLFRSVTNSANTKFGNRYLFGGSVAGAPPFVSVNNGQVRYLGDSAEVLSLVDDSQQVINNLDGITAFNPLAAIEGDDLNVALTLDTQIADLHAGRGVPLGSINIVVDDGANAVGRTVDLTGAETIRDIKTRIEAAFDGSLGSISVDVDPTGHAGLQLSTIAGTIAVSNTTGSRVASDLGIATSALDTLIGLDLDPRLSKETRLADLNGGTGIGDVAGFGLQINNGDRSEVIDLTPVETVEDLINTVRLANLDVEVSLNAAGNGLQFASVVSGARFSIGENGGENATRLGVRTFTATTALAELNHGLGIDRSANQPLTIIRRDGTETTVDLSTAVTVQDVLNALNGVDPGNLSASLNQFGNGISIVDLSGTGPLRITDAPLPKSLGIVGIQDSGDANIPLVGQDPHQRQSDGLLSILNRLESALRSGDLRELGTIDSDLQSEANRFFQVRGLIGTRQRALDTAEDRIQSEQVTISENLSQDFDVDLAEAITAFTARQQTLQATYAAAAQTVGLNLLAFL